MGMMKEAYLDAECCMRRAIECRKDFQTIEACFDFYHSEIVWLTLEDYCDESLTEIVRTYFVHRFNEYFNTTFSV